MPSELSLLQLEDSHLLILSVFDVLYRGAVTIDLGTIKNEQTSVLISNPTNPSTFEMSSFFQLCLMVDTMTTVCDKTFGKVVFAPAPVFNNPAPTASYPVAKSLNTRVVGQSSTYEF